MSTDMKTLEPYSPLALRGKVTQEDVRWTPPSELPHNKPVGVEKIASDQLDKNGVLTMEAGAADAIKGWKDTGDYELPPLLDPKNEKAAKQRVAIAKESVDLIQQLIAAGENGRGFQRKPTYATTTGRFAVPVNLPQELRAGPFQPGAKHRAIVRFTNAAPAWQTDEKADQRAVFVRVTDDNGKIQDLTFTSGGAGNHARNAQQFNDSMRMALAQAKAANKGALGKLGATVGGMVDLIGRQGLRETMRMKKARDGAVDQGQSLASLKYYSRSPIEMGGKLVHLALVPADPNVDPRLYDESGGDPNGLGLDMLIRRRQGDVTFRIVATEAPGLDDMSVGPDLSKGWTVGEVKLPKQMSTRDDMQRAINTLQRQVSSHPSNAWNEGELMHRGELNELLRRTNPALVSDEVPDVYKASSWAHKVEDPGVAPKTGA